MSLKFPGPSDKKTSISAHINPRACFCRASRFRPISFNASLTSSDAVGSATPEARCALPMVDTYRRTVAGFLPLPKHSNTNARTVLGRRQRLQPKHPTRLHKNLPVCSPRPNRIRRERAAPSPPNPPSDRRAARRRMWSCEWRIHRGSAPAIVESLIAPVTAPS